MVAPVTRIAVIDPQPAVRAGLTMLLRTEPGLVPVGAAAGAHDGARLADRLRPDVVLLEPHLLDGDGLGLCRPLRPRTSRCWPCWPTARPPATSPRRCGSTRGGSPGAPSGCSASCARASPSRR